MERYYGHPHIQGLQSAITYRELADTGISVLERMKVKYQDSDKEIVQICGPMSTGGLGNLDGNMRVFAEAIKAFDAARYGIDPGGEVVFDQIPCQDAIKRIAQYRPGDTTYDQRILTDFYAPLFGARIVKACYFLPGWETSRGARWEREYVSQHGIAIKEYPADLYEAALHVSGFSPGMTVENAEKAA